MATCRLLVIRAEYTESTGKRLPLQDLCFTQLALAHQRIREVAHREQNAWVIVALDAPADLEPLPLQALGFRESAESEVHTGEVLHGTDGIGMIGAEFL